MVGNLMEWQKSGRCEGCKNLPEDPGVNQEPAVSAVFLKSFAWCDVIS